jgi:protein-glutamine gamma-glutamyltransferase
MRPQDLAHLRWYLITLAVLAGCCVAIAGGGASLVVGIVAACLAVGGRLQKKPPGPVALSRWRAASWITSGGLIAAGILGTSLILLAVVLVGWLQVHRAWVGKRAVDDRLALLIALLQLLVGCIITLSPVLGPLFVMFVLTAIPGLLLCFLGMVEEGDVRPARPDPAPRGRMLFFVGSLGPVALVLSLVFFLAIPRVEASNLLAGNQGEGVSGFGQNVQLGDVGAIKDNPAIAVRMTVTDGRGDRASGPFYIQGSVLDRFDGRAWTSTVGGARRTPSKEQVDPDPILVRIQELMVEPLGEDVLFGIPEMREVKNLQGIVSRDANGVWRLSGADRRLSYQVRSLIEPTEEPTDAIPDPGLSARTSAERAAAQAGTWVQLPGDLDPRIATLAREIADRAGKDATPWERAKAIQSWLRTDFRYTVVPDDEGARQPLSTFLFDTRSGHCEYFATALAVLLRTQGIPTRVVNGFYGGEWNEFGSYYVFRQQDAHSWVQANFGEAGWRTLDATPEAGAPQAATSLVKKLVDVAVADWYEVVLDYDLGTQLAFLDRVRTATPAWHDDGVGPNLRGSIPLVAFFGFILAAFGAFRLLLGWLAGEREVRHRPAGRIARIHDRTRRQVARRGWHIPPSLPPVEAARWLVIRAGPSAQPLEDLAWLLYRVRYAGEPEDRLLRQATATASRLASLPRRKTAA